MPGAPCYKVSMGLSAAGTAELAARRSRIMEEMHGGVMLLAAAPERVRTADILYPYRQDSDFAYVTGFPEADAVCLLAPDAPERYVLFVRPHDPERAIWVGARIGVEGAVQQYGADAAFSLEELDQVLPRFLEKAPHVYHNVAREDPLAARLLAAIRRAQAGRPRAAGALRRRARAAAGRHRRRPPRRDARGAASQGVARARRGAPLAPPARRLDRRGAREGDLPPLLHAPHEPLARPRRARRRRLCERRQATAARAADGVHGRAGPLHPRRRRGRARGVPRHRHPHRGRRPRHRDGRRGPLRGRAEAGGRGRGAARRRLRLRRALMAGPMEGIRVVELAFWVAGPSAAGILGDWGADVVKIEPPDGDPFRGLFLNAAGLEVPANPPFELDNRGKRSIALDFTKEAGRDIALRLVDRAAVFVTNLRPVVLARLGLDPEGLTERNPRLVYAGITGYGTQGPERDRPAYDVGAFWSRAGIAAALTPPP